MIVLYELGYKKQSITMKLIQGLQKYVVVPYLDWLSRIVNNSATRNGDLDGNIAKSCLKMNWKIE